MIRNKRVMLSIGVMLLLTILLSVSYATFVLSTGKYKSSELLIAELLYGINIEEDGSNTSIIEGNKIIIPENTKSYFLVTVSSLNEIDSKYTLAYKGNINVEYTSRTSWAPSGEIKGYESTTHSKKVRIVINNNTNKSQEVSFKVYGGYKFNNVESISLKDGYKTIGGPYDEVIATSTGRLVDIVENDTKCTTTNEKTCYYGGESINNYVQYPEDIDKSKNLWRITGTYKIGDETVAKLISETYTNTTKEEINTTLSEIYKTIENNNVILETNKFNCSVDECTVSGYNNIGLISIYEYENIGGLNSYLKAINSYFATNNNNIQNITKEGIEEVTDETTSGVRPSIYLKTETKVRGSGTNRDPYVISNGSDINLISVTLNEQSTTLTYRELINSKIVNNIKCDKGTKAEWDLETRSITMTDVQVPDYCTIDFKDGYSVNLEAINGTVTSGTPVSVGHNGSVKFTVEPINSDYILPDESGISCPDGAKATINGNEVTISEVKQSQTCFIKMLSKSLFTQILLDNPNVATRANFDEVFTSNTANTIYKVNGELTESGKDVYYFAGSEDETKRINNWVKFGKDKDNKDLYWRIIRTNEDGSIRLLFTGNGTTSEDWKTSNGFIGTSKYNDSKDHMYAGYMYGSTGGLENHRKNTNSSAIKKTIDTWYGSGLNTKTDGTYTYDKYISRTAIYCNDRSGDGWNSSRTMHYAGQLRLYNNGKDGRQPSYRCGYGSTENYMNTSGTWATRTTGMYSDASNADRFSSSTDTRYANGVTPGNGKLTHPIALMTADEPIYI